MSRREFPTAVKVAVIKRSTRKGATYCEGCGALAKRWQIDHIRPDGMGGEPVIANAQLLCEPCFGAKNPKDTSTVARAKRQEAANLGARHVKREIPAGPSSLSTKPKRAPRESLPPRSLYR